MDERPQRKRGLVLTARWFGVLGVPTGPLMGLGLLLGLLGFAVNHHLWEQGAHRPEDPLHAYVKRSFTWCFAAVVLPMLMMIAGGVWYVVNHSESTMEALSGALR
jgi:hypothetical protein